MSASSHGLEVRSHETPASAGSRQDSTVTETCSKGTTTVYTTVDQDAVSPGNFEIGSANFSANTPLGYDCNIS